MGADEITRVWAGDILKWDQTPDGLMVHGVAASPALDLDAQVCDPTWLKSAMPDWMRWGNVREQHSNIAAGVGKTLEAGNGDKWSLSSLVVDPSTQAKVKAGVLKGYSVGIKRASVVKDAGAPNGRIVGGKIVEISLVDRPCNPDAMLDQTSVALAKAEGAVFAPVDQAGVVLHEIDESATKAEETGQPAKVRSAKILTPSAHRRALATLAKVNSGEIVKYDEADDIAGAQKILAILCDLIISEATEMKAGRPEEYYDIQTLMQATQAVRSFLRSETDQAGQGPDAPKPDGSDVAGSISYAMLAASAEKVGLSAEQIEALKAAMSDGKTIPAPRKPADDVTKAAKPITMADGSYPILTQKDLDDAAGLAGSSNSHSKQEVQAHVRRAASALGLSLPDSYRKGKKSKTKAAHVDKAVGPGDNGIAELIKSAVAEATAGQEATIKSLQAEIAKVKATPIPGGPVLANATRPTTKPNPALAEIASLRKQASAITDPQTARAYAELADRKEAELKA